MSAAAEKQTETTAPLEFQNRLRFSAIPYPEQWTARYHEEDKARVHAIVDWLNTNKMPMNSLYTLGGSKAKARYRAVIRGEYTSPVRKSLDEIEALLSRFEVKMGTSSVPFCPDTSINSVVATACQLARARSLFSIVTANVGTGKTRSLTEYANKNRNTFLIHAIPHMTVSSFVNELVKQMGLSFAQKTMSVENKFLHLIDTLKVMDALLIVDEAEKVSEKMLEYTRRIRDLSLTGVVLAGTPALELLITPVGGTFDQIRSRVTFYSGQILKINDDDAKLILQAAFPRDEIDKKLFEVFRYYCNGSMRMLCEQIIPNVYEFGIDKGEELSGELVTKICKGILRLK